VKYSDYKKHNNTYMMAQKMLENNNKQWLFTTI
jgi:hypothetical protein